MTVSGEKNRVFLPESTHTTYELVKEAHPNQEYDWILIPDYGHADCLLGRNAVYDVYPHILRALDRHAYDNLHLCEAKLARISHEAMAMQSISGKVGFFSNQSSANVSIKAWLNYETLLEKHCSFSCFLGRYVLLPRWLVPRTKCHTCA